MLGKHEELMQIRVESTGVGGAAVLKCQQYADGPTEPLAGSSAEESAALLMYNNVAEGAWG